MPNPLPSRQTLRDLLDYDPETGALTWKVRPLAYCKSEKTQAAWNRRWAGKPALNAKVMNGHPNGPLLGKIYRADRVIFKWMTGKEPFNIIHKDRDAANLKWENLEGRENKWGKDGESR